MYTLYTSDHVPEIGSHTGNQIDSFHDGHSNVILENNVEFVDKPVARLSKNAKFTSVLQVVSNNWIAISSKLLIDIADNLDNEQLFCKELKVIDSYGQVKDYYWYTIKKLDVNEYVVPEASLVSRQRFNKVGYPEISYPHIPIGAIELRPESIEAAINFKGPAPEGGWSRVLRWLAMEIKPEKKIPSIFWMPFGIFCTDEFYKMYHDKSHTGLQFRKLEATPSQWRGERTIINYPSYFS